MAPGMDVLDRGAAQLGVELSKEQLDQFCLYQTVLADWNQRMNLTSITGDEEVQVGHFLDSLTLLAVLPQSLVPGIKLVDVGAGAGFPGLPLKIAFPGIKLTLVESVGKKASFLEHLAGALGLTGVEVHKGRAEEAARRPEMREVFDLAVARGVAGLAELLEYTLPFCKVGGVVVAWKRGDLAQEIAGAENALRSLGGRLKEVYPVEAAGLEDGRVLVLVDKIAATPDRYPRRAGIPGKRPL